MTVELSSARQAYLAKRVAAGGFASTDEAIEEAVRQMELRERAPGQDLIDAMQACPVPDFDFDLPRAETRISNPVEF